jgi:hypothetical protein
VLHGWKTVELVAPWSLGLAETCGRAIEFKYGDHKTFVQAGFARTQRPKELMPGRVNLSSDWIDTACETALRPRKPVQLRRGCEGRNVFWPVDDLKEHFRS